MLDITINEIRRNGAGIMSTVGMYVKKPYIKIHRARGEEERSKKGLSKSNPKCGLLRADSIWGCSGEEQPEYAIGLDWMGSTCTVVVRGDGMSRCHIDLAKTVRHARATSFEPQNTQKRVSGFQKGFMICLAVESSVQGGGGV